MVVIVATVVVATVGVVGANGMAIVVLRVLLQAKVARVMVSSSSPCVVLSLNLFVRRMHSFSDLVSAFIIDLCVFVPLTFQLGLPILPS